MRTQWIPAPGRRFVWRYLLVYGLKLPATYAVTFATVHWGWKFFHWLFGAGEPLGMFEIYLVIGTPSAAVYLWRNHYLQHRRQHKRPE